MQTRLFSLVFGVAYIVVGLIGFIPALRTTPPSDAPVLDHSSAAYGFLFGEFPVNAVHLGFYIALGVIGVIVSARLGPARAYCQILFLLFALMTIAGFMPKADTLWGWLPLFGSDTWVHAATAVIASYFGFVAPEPTYLEPSSHLAHA